MTALELIGRSSEIERLDALLDRARSGSSGVLIVRGSPGIGMWAPDLIESFVHVGREADAEKALATFEPRAEHTGRPSSSSARRRSTSTCANIYRKLDGHSRTELARLVAMDDGAQITS